MLDTLHVTYTEGGTDALPLITGGELREGDEALGGRTPMQAIREISASGSFNGHAVRGAWIMRVDLQHPHGDEWTAATWGPPSFYAESKRRLETEDLGGPGQE